MNEDKKVYPPPPQSHVLGSDDARSAILSKFPDSTEVVLLTDPELGEVTDIDMTIGTLNVILARCYDFERMRDENRELRTTIEKLGSALKPFSDFAGELFARNFNASDSHGTFMTETGHVSIYNRDFYAARAALSSTEGAEG